MVGKMLHQEAERWEAWALTHHSCRGPQGQWEESTGSLQGHRLALTEREVREPQLWDHKELNMAKNMNMLAADSSLGSPARNTAQVNTLILAVKSLNKRTLQNPPRFLIYRNSEIIYLCYLKLLMQVKSARKLK